MNKIVRGHEKLKEIKTLLVVLSSCTFTAFHETPVFPGPVDGPDLELRYRSAAREGRESLARLTLPLPRKPTRAR